MQYIKIGKVVAKQRASYTPVDNATVDDLNISNSALGCLVRGLRNREDFTTSLAGLEAKNREYRRQNPASDIEGRRALSSQLSELIENGYCVQVIEKDAVTGYNLTNGGYYVFHELKIEPVLRPRILLISRDKNGTLIATESKGQRYEMPQFDPAAIAAKAGVDIETAKKILAAMQEPEADTTPEAVTDTPPSVSDFKEGIRADKEFLKYLSGKYSIGTIKEIIEYLNVFDALPTANKTSFEAYKSHFDFWLPKYRHSEKGQNKTAQKEPQDNTKIQMLNWAMSYTLNVEKTTFEQFITNLATIKDVINEAQRIDKIADNQLSLAIRKREFVTNFLEDRNAALRFYNSKKEPDKVQNSIVELAKQMTA